MTFFILFAWGFEPTGQIVTIFHDIEVFHLQSPWHFNFDDVVKIFDVWKTWAVWFLELTHLPIALYFDVMS